jgi:hypothetical protein
VADRAVSRRIRCRKFLKIGSPWLRALELTFLRIATGYSTVPTRVLGSALVSELVQRSDLDAKQLQMLVLVRLFKHQML